MLCFKTSCVGNPENNLLNADSTIQGITLLNTSKKPNNTRFEPIHHDRSCQVLVNSLNCFNKFFPKTVSSRGRINKFMINRIECFFASRDNMFILSSILSASLLILSDINVLSVICLLGTYAACVGEIIDSKIGLTLRVIPFVIILTPVFVRLMGCKLFKMEVSLSFFGIKVKTELI